MATMLNGTMGTAKSLLESAMHDASHAAEKAVDNAKGAVDSAKDGTQHAVSSARSTFVDGIHALTGAVTVLRNLGIADALGWVGLERRRSPLMSMGIFGAGFAAGAGAGVLFAPTSGKALRGRIIKAFTGPEAKETLHRFETEVQTDVKAIGDKAGELAGKAKDAAMKAERTVEHKVETAATAVKDASKHAVDDAMAALGASDAGRAGAAQGTQATHAGQGTNGNDGSAKPHGAAGPQHR